MREADRPEPRRSYPHQPGDPDQRPRLSHKLSREPIIVYLHDDWTSSAITSYSSWQSKHGPLSNIEDWLDRDGVTRLEAISDAELKSIIRSIDGHYADSKTGAVWGWFCDVLAVADAPAPDDSTRSRSVERTVDRKIRSSNTPLQNKDRRNGQEKGTHPVEPSEFESLMDAAHNQHKYHVRDQLIFLTQYCVGTRANETADLKLSQIDRENQKIEIEHESKKHRERILTYPDRLEACLDHYLEQRRGKHKHCHDIPVSDDAEIDGMEVVVEDDDGNEQRVDRNPYLFPGEPDDDDERHAHLSPSTISRLVRETAEEAGIQEDLSDGEGDAIWKIRSHGLRAGFATVCWDGGDGAELDEIRRAMGHKRIKQTREYIGGEPDDPEEMMQQHAPFADRGN